MHVQEKLEVQMPGTETRPHVMRVGWSVDSSPLNVGEAPLSYGYGGTGRASCNNKFTHYGEPYSTDDVITCYIDLDAVPKAIFFAKNGKYLDVAFRLGHEAEGKVFYPHISVKNMRFFANFGAANPYFPPVQGFYFIQHLPLQMLSSPPPAPRNRQECEVLMMVGLPSCGKTTWLDKFVKDNPDKKYNVLGSNDILIKMKVMGLGRKRNYHGRWDALIKQATGILNEMLKVAKHKNRNYILDQTNVYSNARRRKMGNFHGYHRIAVVLVNENSILMQRNDEVVRRDGKVVPESAFMEMKANFMLPVQGEIFDEVWYIEENKERSQQLVREFNEEGRHWKEEQKKRPIDSVQPEVDFKKPRYGESQSLHQPADQHGGQGPGERHPNIRPRRGGFQQGSHPQHFSRGGRPNVPVQESQLRETHSKEYQQPNPDAYPQRNQQYNPPFRGRNQDYQENSYKEERKFPQDAGGRGEYHQGQSRTSSEYQRGGQDGGRYPGESTGNNQPTGHFQGSWGEGRQSTNNPRHHQGSQGHQGAPGYQGAQGSFHGNTVNDQPAKSQRDWSKSGPHVKEQHGQGEWGYSRGHSGNIYHQTENTRNNEDKNYSTTGVHSTQGGYKNTNESYYTANHPGEYDSSQNYRGPRAYTDPPQRYHGSSEIWNAPRHGFNNQTQGYWSSGQGWGSPPGAQNYGTSLPNVSQSIKHENSNPNQQYCQRQPQSY